MACSGQGFALLAGMATFMGEVNGEGGGTQFIVERMLRLPLVLDPREIWTPSDSIRAALMTRLAQELARRGLPVPVIPQVPPTPTSGSLARANLMARMQQEMAAHDVPVQIPTSAPS